MIFKEEDDDGRERVTEEEERVSICQSEIFIRIKSRIKSAATIRIESRIESGCSRLRVQ